MTVKLICLEEHRITFPDSTKTELYEDGMGYVYTVSDKKAKDLLATGKFAIAIEEGIPA